MTESIEKNHIFTKIADSIVYVLQSIYLFCATPFVKLANKMSEKVKNGIIVAVSFLIMVQVYLRQTKISLYWLELLDPPSFIKYTLIDAVACLLIALFAIASIKGTLKRVKCNPAMVLLWTGMSLMMLINAEFISLDWAAYAIIFIIVLPAVYFVWQNRRDYSNLFFLVIKGVILFNIIFIIGSIFLRPVSNQQYCGLFINPNSLGQYLTMTVPIFLVCYDIAIKKQKKSSIVWSLLGLGTATGFVVFSCSRTAYVSLIATALVWIGLKLYFWKKQKNQELKKILIPIVAAIALCAIFVPLTWNAIHYGTKLATAVLPHGSGVSINSSIDDIFSRVNKRVATKDKDLNMLSTHRTLIWKEFLKQVGVLGHSRGDIFVKGYGWANTTHNNVVQMAYDNGIFAAIFYLAFNLLSLWLSFKYYLKTRIKSDYAFIPLLISIAFSLTSLVSSVFHPFNYGLSFMFWMVQIPLFDKCLGEEETV